MDSSVLAEHASKLALREMNATSPDLAFVQGVIDAYYSAMKSARTGNPADAKLYHRYELNSTSELSWHQGAQFTAQKMMSGAMLQHELRSAK